jgi:hypothetical protein
LQVKSDGTTKCGAYLQSSGSNETSTDDSSAYPIILSQTFMNNHCYAHNYADGTIGIGSAQTSTTIAISM